MSLSPRVYNVKPRQVILYDRWLQIIAVDSSPPSAAYLRHWIGSALLQITACRLFGAEPYLDQCWVVVNWTLTNKLQWNSIQNAILFIQENASYETLWKTQKVLNSHYATFSNNWIWILCSISYCSIIPIVKLSFDWDVCSEYLLPIGWVGMDTIYLDEYGRSSPLSNHDYLQTYIFILFHLSWNVPVIHRTRIVIKFYKQSLPMFASKRYFSRAVSRFTLSQCETSLQSNGVSHWLDGLNLQSALLFGFTSAYYRCACQRLPSRLSSWGS